MALRIGSYIFLLLDCNCSHIVKEIHVMDSVWSIAWWWYFDFAFFTQTFAKVCCKNCTKLYPKYPVSSFLVWKSVPHVPITKDHWSDWGSGVEDTEVYLFLTKYQEQMRISHELGLSQIQQGLTILLITRWLGSWLGWDRDQVRVKSAKSTQTQPSFKTLLGPSR